MKIVRGVFAGMTKEQLETFLKNAQAAYVELATGKKGVSFSYTQGNGTRSVTYTQTSIADLLTLIQSLQAALGIGGRRRAVGFRF